jgi:benzaldehyde dehydrogenase (NAD)
MRWSWWSEPGRFGTVAVITTFRNDEEAIALANATDYRPRGGRRLCRSRHSGIVHINDQTVLYGVYGPIGGLGDSGNGFG